MDWIAQHGDLVSALTGVGTLIVWIIYLQVFVSSYRRQLRATLLITRGAGDEDDTRCFVSNMSAGPVYVQSVMVTLETEDRKIVSAATDIRDIQDKTQVNSLDRTRQGPLHPGQLKDIGSFRSLMSHGLKETDASPAVVRAVLVEVLGVYGSEDLPVGARRRFILVRSQGGVRIEGDTIETQQIRKRRERRQLVHDLKRDK
ncbi:hypothetical protein [Shinella sp. HZN7]|uniref:hypothetical protein n=1 Tax=Shinella sp. (strain HZN7) TaxID=879274 RepID=UPI0007DAA745|nr:hypothetical protein [Shinella sp. HZN7]ANH08633.1 hypothetical protein shn_31320 [Shinella sp. HZN7]